MFKKLLKKIVETDNQQDAWDSVVGNIEDSYQKELITWEEHELLYSVIEKMA